MNQRRAVVIEDDPDISLLISTLLHTMGYAVHTAQTGPAGIQAVRDLRPSLITTDLGLPGLGGLEVVRAIRPYTDAPILVISAKSDVAEIEDVLAAGANSYLTKPFRPRVLQEHVAALQEGG